MTEDDVLALLWRFLMACIIVGTVLMLLID